MDRNQFSAFYQLHFRTVYRVCYTYMKNTADAEDCTEDVFVKAMTADPVFESDSHARAWLTVTAMNLCKDRLKHWWRQKTVSMELVDELPADPMQEPDLTLDAVRMLPPKYKDVIYLYYYECYPTEEIARMLKRPPSTVRNQLRDGRAKLKKILGGDVL